MKNSSIILSLLLLVAFTFVGLPKANAQDKDISVANIWEEYQFFGHYVPGFNFRKKGPYYTKLSSSREIWEYNITSGEQTRNLYLGEEGMYINGYSFSDDEKKILLETESERVYRYSSIANYLVWDTEKKESISVSSHGKQRHARFNPAGDKVAFVRDNNLFFIDLESKKEAQITKDGKHNEIINGASDWVYEEEFAIDRAFEWSPDGSKIAFLRFDESKVQQFNLTTYTGALYPVNSPFKYPKAGELNSVVTVHLYDLVTQKISQVEIGGDDDQYVPRITWTKSNKLCITRLNRLQNELDLLLFDPKKDKIATLLNEKSEYFINVHDNLIFLNNDQFTWTSDEDGYNHIYLYSNKGKKIAQLTKGEFDVVEFHGVDEENGRVFFQAAMSSPINREICYVGLKEDSEIITLSPNIGMNEAQFNSDFQYFIIKSSDATTPATYALYKMGEKEAVRVLEDNKPLVERLKEYKIGKHEFFTFKNRADIELNGWMITPPDFDESKQYPVFMYVYGGPSRQTALNAWDDANFMWFQMLAQKGYIVVSVDNRGTEARGEAFRKSTYLQLGKYETEDQIDAAKYLGGLKYVDKTRIGIFGWSFGGYLSTLCLSKGADVFKMAIAVAPVINWKWYDTIYTERYMRTPGENDKGYEDNSPINFADKIAGGYLLVHGMADDNVHMQHSVEMAAALIKNNIPFEQAFYPNKNHGIYGGKTRSHLYNKMTNFILNEL